MHSDLFRLCDILRIRGIRVTVLSSGLLLDRHAAGIVASVDDVIVSLDGPPEVHDRIRGVPTAFRAAGSRCPDYSRDQAGFPDLCPLHHPAQQLLAPESYRRDGSPPRSDGHLLSRRRRHIDCLQQADWLATGTPGGRSANRRGSGVARCGNRVADFRWIHRRNSAKASQDHPARRAGLQRSLGVGGSRGEWSRAALLLSSSNRAGGFLEHFIRRTKWFEGGRVSRRPRCCFQSGLPPLRLFAELATAAYGDVTAINAPVAGLVIPFI